MSDSIAPDLAGKSVLVTGASTGIGAAAARAFAAAGCRVAIHYNASLNRAEEVAADVRFAGAEAFLVGGDLRTSAKAREVVDEAAARFGGPSPTCAGRRRRGRPRRRRSARRRRLPRHD